MENILNVNTLIGLIAGTAIGTLLSDFIKGILKKLVGKKKSSLSSKQVVKGLDNIVVAQSKDVIINKTGEDIRNNENI